MNMKLHDLKLRNFFPGLSKFHFRFVEETLFFSFKLSYLSLFPDRI